MTGSSLSSREAHLIADILRESDTIDEFVGEATLVQLQADKLRVYAIQKALQNACEACIQLDGKRGEGRFAVIFPNRSLGAMKDIGNRLRHDYGRVDVVGMWADIHDILPLLRADAEAVLSAQRRLRGRPD